MGGPESTASTRAARSTTTGTKLTEAVQANASESMSNCGVKTLSGTIGDFVSGWQQLFEDSESERSVKPLGRFAPRQHGFLWSPDFD